MKFFLTLLVLITLLFVTYKCDPDNKEGCGQTYNEVEPNNGDAKGSDGKLDQYNNFGIILGNGCKVTINGTITDGDSDFFMINGGSSQYVKVKVTWSGGANVINYYIWDFTTYQGYITSGMVDNTLGSGSGAGEGTTGTGVFESYTNSEIYALLFVEVRDAGVGAGNSKNYTLTIEGDRLD